MLCQQLGRENSRVDALLLFSLAWPGTPVLRVRDRSRGMRPSGSLQPPPGARCEEGETDGYSWMRVSGHAAHQRAVRVLAHESTWEARMAVDRREPTVGVQAPSSCRLR